MMEREILDFLVELSKKYKTYVTLSEPFVIFTRDWNGKMDEIEREIKKLKEKEKFYLDRIFFDGFLFLVIRGQEVNYLELLTKLKNLIKKIK